MALRNRKISKSPRFFPDIIVWAWDLLPFRNCELRGYSSEHTCGWLQRPLENTKWPRIDAQYHCSHMHYFLEPRGRGIPYFPLTNAFHDQWSEPQSKNSWWRSQLPSHIQCLLGIQERHFISQRSSYWRETAEVRCLQALDREARRQFSKFNHRFQQPESQE